MTITISKDTDPRDLFEQLHPMPNTVTRVGDGYAINEFSSWGGAKYCNMFEGFKLLYDLVVEEQGGE